MKLRKMSRVVAVAAAACSLAVVSACSSGPLSAPPDDDASNLQACVSGSPGLHVCGAEVNADGREVSATVEWDPDLLSADQVYRVRLVALLTDTAGYENEVLGTRDVTPGPTTERVTFDLDDQQAQVVQSASRVVVSATQQDMPVAGVAQRSYVATDQVTVNQPAADGAAITPASHKDATCSAQPLSEGTNHQGCDYTAVSIPNCDLRGANLTNASFQGADLRNCTLDGATVSGADFSGALTEGVSARQVVGTPAKQGHPKAIGSGPGVSCAGGDGEAGTCQIGDVGPGGGIVFFVDNDRPAGSRFLEYARDGWHSGPDPTAAWGCLSSESNPRANGVGIGEGWGNTARIVHNGCDMKDSAAKLAWDYHSNGTTSWYLPAKDELVALCSRTGCGTAVNKFGFTNGDYWSSTQSGESSKAAFNTNYNSGRTNWAPVNGIKSVRPIREF